MKLSVESLIGYFRDSMNIADPIAPDTELFSTGLLDSVGLMNVIAYVEQTAGIDVRAADVTLENFDSPTRIVAYASSQA